MGCGASKEPQSYGQGTAQPARAAKDDSASKAKALLVMSWGGAAEDGVRDEAVRIFKMADTDENEALDLGEVRGP